MNKRIKRTQTHKTPFFVQATDADGRYMKVMYRVKVIPESEAHAIPLPPECNDWLSYIQCAVHLRQWMCGKCLCPAPRVGASELHGVLVREHENRDSRIFVSHLCHECYEQHRNGSDFYLTHAYLIPTGLPITWQPKEKN